MLQNESIIYQREIKLSSEEGLYADLVLKSDARNFGTLILQVNKEHETRFLVDLKRHSSRFMSGLLPVTDKVKLFYTIETSTGYST